jgi:hypothetical protein
MLRRGECLIDARTYTVRWLLCRTSAASGRMLLGGLVGGFIYVGLTPQTVSEWCCPRTTPCDCSCTDMLGQPG